MTRTRLYTNNESNWDEHDTKTKTRRRRTGNTPNSKSHRKPNENKTKQARTAAIKVREWAGLDCGLVFLLSPCPAEEFVDFLSSLLVWPNSDGQWQTSRNKWLLRHEGTLVRTPRQERRMGGSREGQDRWWEVQEGTRMWILNLWWNPNCSTAASSQSSKGWVRNKALFV